MTKVGILFTVLYLTKIFVSRVTLTVKAKLSKQRVFIKVIRQKHIVETAVRNCRNTGTGNGQRLSKKRVVPLFRQPNVSTCRNCGTHLSKYRYVEIPVCRNNGFTPIIYTFELYGLEISLQHYSLFQLQYWHSVV